MIPSPYFNLGSFGKTTFLTAIFMMAFSLFTTATYAQDCTADAGTLGSVEVMVMGDSAQITATPNEDAVLPNDSTYTTIYVLTSGEDLVIESVSEMPSFKVPFSGTFTIHTLIYDPATLDLGIVEFGVTTGVDVNNLLVQGGGDICAALDVAGATFVFSAEEEEPACEAMAGTLVADSDNCLDSVATLTAAVDTEPTVPENYEVLYVLTSGEDLVIEDVNEAPTFDVTEEGRFTIHTLVFDSTLDLSIIEFGVTTGVDVNGLLVQGGGDICAALDVAGAPFDVKACEEEPACEAKAGTLMAMNGCLEDGTATLTAAVDMEPTVPENYEVLYVLTSGEDLVIEDVNEAPTFDVTEEGRFTIHTLVFDSTLDLSIIEFGVTTGVDVNGLLVQGGGDICAALDVAGAPFDVKACEEETTCEATFGSLKKTNVGCIDGAGFTNYRARLDEQPVVPEGYEVLFVLTSGDRLVIEQVNDEPVFRIEEVGVYTIHTLVYDPATLDLGIVVPGVTTGVDVNNLLIQGGGDICAALDVAGARAHIDFCHCEAEAGTLAPSFKGCINNGKAATITAVRTSPFVEPVRPYYDVIYVLTSGSNLVIEAVADEPEFNVTKPGRYTIHTLVYDKRSLDLGIVQFGVTTGVDVVNLLADPAICGDLDVAGAKFDVEMCECPADFGSLEAKDNDDLTPGHPVTLEAEIDDEPTVPSGFQVIYVLTKGDGLVIQNVNSMPKFDVHTTGDYTIHTLVYDPSTLDLGIVVFGQTTGFDVNSLLIQGGGQICAALDVAGAKFTVGEEPCKADFGGLEANEFDCIRRDRYGFVRTKITADVVEQPNVPKGYKLIYVLTSGTDLVIENTNSAPSFFVYEEGRYTIHTLVYKPSSLDLGIIEPGVTTGVDVNNLLIQGGGDICAALDVAGAKFMVDRCGNNFGYSATPDAYPNPTANELNINIPVEFNDKRMTIDLMDRQGNVLSTQRLAPGTTNTEFDMSNFIDGVYIVRFIYDNATVKRMMISKF